MQEIKLIISNNLITFWLIFSCVCLGLKISNEKSIQNIIFYRNQKQNFFLKKSTFLSFTLIFFICFFKILEIFSFTSQLIRLTSAFLTISLGVLVLLRRKGKLYNSLEEIYASYLSLVIIFFGIGQFNGAFIISSLVYISSLSAGICKFKSNIWGFRGERNGFIKFVSLPTLSRPFWSNFIEEIFKRRFSKLVFKNIFVLITIITPYYQCSIGILFILGLLFSLNSFVIVAFLMNILFIGMLFIIADLNWIVSLNALLSIFSFLSLSNIYNYNFSVSNFEIIFVIYFLTGTYGLLFNALSKNSRYFKIDKILRFINFNLVPFSVYSETHLENICSYFIEPKKTNKFFDYPSKINAFKSDGLRSKKENFRSIHLHALVYVFTNYVNFIYFSKVLDESIKKPKMYTWQLQLDTILKSISPCQLTLYQFVWNEFQNKYKKNLLFSVQISKDESLQSLLKKEINFKNDLQPRIFLKN